MTNLHGQTGPSWLAGIGWSVLTQAGTAIAMMVSTIIAARLIPPRDFGKLGIAMLVLQTLEALTQSGFDQAAVQRRDISTGTLNTIWTINILRGAAIFIALAVSAPLISTFFKETNTTFVIVAVSSTAAIRGLAHTQTIVWSRTFRFANLFWLNAGEAFIRAGFLVWCAFWLRNVWALVFATVAGSVGYVLLSHLIFRQPLALRVNVAEARSLFAYGKWITALAVVSLLMNQMDNFLVARMLDTQALGYYQMAFTFAMLPMTHITKVIGRVTLSGYARTLSDSVRLRESFSNVSGAVMLVVLSVSVYLFFLAPYVVKFVLGSQWRPMIGPLRILILAGVIRSLIAVGGGLFCGIGRPDLDFRMNIGRALTLVLLGAPAIYYYRLDGISWAVVISILACIPTYLSGLRESIAISFHRLGQTLLVGLSCSGVLGGALWSASATLGLTIISAVVVGIVIPLIWVIGLLAMQQRTRLKPFQSILNLRKPLNHGK